MVEKRRPCKKCGVNRAERFFSSPRGHVCARCRKGRVKLTSKGVRLQETYDITLAEWYQILERQGGVCAICKGKRPSYDVDHDHKLEKLLGVRASVRGLLCRRCNRRLLPAALDSVEILYAAIEYLTSAPARLVLT